MFVGLLAFYPVGAMHPSGQAAVRQPLWAFYADALPRLVGPTTTLGPASSNSGALAVVGGGIAALVGWWCRRRRSSG